MSRQLKSFADKTPIKLRSFEAKPSPSFRYTTPSVFGKREVKERRARGCIERPRNRWCFKPAGGKSDRCFHSEAEATEAAGGQAVKLKPEKRFTGERCRSGSPDEGCQDTVYDSFCAGSNSDPCGSPRSTCPVQLVWVDGKPNLRFCKEQNKPGYLVPVKDVRDAMAVSNAACASWPYKLGAVVERPEADPKSGWDPKYFDKHAPEVLRRARAGHPERGGLGELDGFGRSAAWLLGGTVVGLLALRYFGRQDGQQG